MGHTKKGRIIIFDTTLRDGEQSPGASMTIEEKIRVAKRLEKLNVDVIEAGFPIASEGDFKAVREIASQIKTPVICALARCLPKDIEIAARALEPALKKRIHVFIATSQIHMEHKLKMSPEHVLKEIKNGVSYAKTFTDDIEFSAEDASRSELPFLTKAVETAIEAGATTINIPDTVGYAMPEEFGKRVTYLKRHVKGIETINLSVHCHNDLGLAVANSLAAIQAGATQIECTINGIGERSGNCALEEIVMAIKTRADLTHAYTNIRTTELCPTSRFLSEITGMTVQRNKAIVGKNAFAHESGIHQHGMLSRSETYEIIRPEDVGAHGNQLVIGKHSGRHALKNWLEKRHLSLSDGDFQDFFEQIKCLSDEKKSLEEEDILSLFEHHKLRTTVI